MANYLREQERVYDYVQPNMDDVFSSTEESLESILSDIAKIYATVLVGVKSTEYYAKMLERNRLAKLTKKSIESYNKAYKDASAKTMRYAKDSLVDTFYRNQYIYNYVTKEDLSFVKLNEELVDYTLRGSSDLWKKLKSEVKNLTLYTPKNGETLTSTIVKHRTADVRRMKEYINRIFLTGEKFDVVQKEMKDVFANPYNVERILRTEITRLSNLGAYTNAVEMEKQGVEQRKMWLATLDLRTRGKHQHLDHQEADVEGYFKSGGARALFPGQFGIASMDINCRCTHIYVIGDILPTQRRGRNPLTGKNELFSWVDYKTWLKANLKG